MIFVYLQSQRKNIVLFGFIMSLCLFILIFIGLKVPNGFSKKKSKFHGLYIILEIWLSLGGLGSHELWLLWLKDYGSID
jgi:hypothetical protein